MKILKPDLLHIYLYRSYYKMKTALQKQRLDLINISFVKKELSNFMKTMPQKCYSEIQVHLKQCFFFQ